jgi:aryl-alcohol dehydrogenase-like predicted oxidoreductase
MQLASDHELHRLVTMQEEYSLLHRGIEKTLVPIAKHYGLSIMAYSPLAEGMLSEKYLSGIPKDSRAAYAEHLKKSISEEKLKVVRELSSFAKDKGISLPQLALAWILNKQSSLGVTVIPIIGISKGAQLAENLKALEINLAEKDIESIEEIASKMPE